MKNDVGYFGGFARPPARACLAPDPVDRRTDSMDANHAAEHENAVDTLEVMHAMSPFGMLKIKNKKNPL